MVVSALVNRKFIEIFEDSDTERAAKKLRTPKGLKFRVTENVLAEQIETEIVTAVDLAAEVFKTPLAEGRSLRKDDVRSRRSQETLLEKVKAVIS